MSFEEVMGAVSRLMVATDAFAAIGADLTLRTSGDIADPEIVSALRGVSEAAGLGDLNSLAPPQLAMVLSLIRLYFAQANDLMSDPARAPGWTVTDPVILDGFGRGSMMIPPLLAAAPEFTRVTSFLDVGAGVGLLAVSAANVWPAATVVGIDVWEPALDRARNNVKEAGLDDRITLRNQSVVALDDLDTYDCAWVPTFFLSEDALADGLPKIVDALRPGGWIVLGRFEPVPDPLAQATTALRTVRSGGCTIDAERSIDLLSNVGCTSVRDLEHGAPMPMGFVIGQRPAS